MRKFVKKALLEHKVSFTPGQPRDLMDALCEEVAATTDFQSSFYGKEGGEF